MTTTSPASAVKIGPSGLPEHTLGWQVLQWTADYLQQPDGPSSGEPWNFTNEQARFLLWWYAVDSSGRFVYRYAMLRRMKGWGKDPVAAAIACIEFVGPCRHSGWLNGEPVAEAHSAAWVQIAAVSKEQTRNTMTLFPGMLSPKALSEYDIDMGKEIIYAERGRKRIEAVTSSPRALEGGRPTIVIKNESHHWIQSNEGHAMANVIARNLAKSRDGSARALAISNAHAIGEDSDAERDWDAFRKDPSGFLYDSLEAPPVDFESEESIKTALADSRGDSLWVDIDRLLAEVRDPRTTEAMAKRFYFNQVAAEEDAPFDKEKFAALAVNYSPAPRSLITLGFDGSRRKDHTALIATEIKSGYQWVAGYWEPRPDPQGETWIDETEVLEVVHDVFQKYRVHRLYADPYWWSEQLATLTAQYGEKIVIFATNSYRKMAMACANYREAIEAGTLTHDGDRRFVESIGHAHKRMHDFKDDDNNRMWTIQKEREDSPLKKDAADAAILSWQARQDAIKGGITGIDPELLPITSGAVRKPEFSGVRGSNF